VTRATTSEQKFVATAVLGAYLFCAYFALGTFAEAPLLGLAAEVALLAVSS
jgi:hypothetical protein